MFFGEAELYIQEAGVTNQCTFTLEGGGAPPVAFSDCIYSDNTNCCELYAQNGWGYYSEWATNIVETNYSTTHSLRLCWFDDGAAHLTNRCEYFLSGEYTSDELITHAIEAVQEVGYPGDWSSIFSFASTELENDHDDGPETQADVQKMICQFHFPGRKGVRCRIDWEEVTLYEQTVYNDVVYRKGGVNVTPRHEFVEGDGMSSKDPSLCPLLAPLSPQNLGLRSPWKCRRICWGPRRCA